MAIDNQVNHSKREAIKEVFPDNPEYVWPDGKKPKDDEARSKKWFRVMKKRFESFEHNKKSSIYNTYGHNYEEPEGRTIKMPEGSVPSGNTNYMKSNLLEALQYKIENFNNPAANGWRVFERITGKYDVEAVDSETLVARQTMLEMFLDLLKEDEGLLRYDPLTGKEAITEIVAEGNMKPIEYMFPLGLEDTDYIHYVVMEPEVLETIVDSKEDIDKIIEYEILNFILESGSDLHPKRGVGVVMKKHGNALRPHIKYVQEKIAEIVIEYNSMLTKMGQLKKIFAKMDEPATADIVNEGNLVETYKKITTSSILKKIESKVLLKRLKRITPPSDGKGGGASWPISAGGNYMLWVTTDPFEMLTKSTGRMWGERNASCENWDGCYAEGPVSDIKYGNCVVWVYQQGEEEYRQEIGRFLLRWGEGYRGGDKLDYDIGVESQVYPKNPRESPWGFSLLGAIGNILKEAGFLKYETCNTPYKFLGYSDKAGAGKCKINYDSKIFLKGQGEVEVGIANALVTMASDENLSYADSGYVLNYGNAQALIALAQNPVIWIYENSIRRLFNRALDLEEGPQIVEFLFDSQVVNFNWIGGVLDTLEVFDSNYDNPYEANNSLIISLLRNGLCIDSIHEQILEMHPGYQIGNQVVPIWAVAYLNLFEYPGTPMVTSAPSHILDMMTDEITKKHFFTDILRQNTPSMEEYLIQIIYPAHIRASFSNSSIPSQKKYAKHFIQLIAMNNMIFNPKLSLKSYAKLLTHFHSLWKKKLNDGGIFDLALDHTKKLFAISLCIPLKNRGDWGYMGNFGGVDLGLDTIPECLKNITVIVDGDEIKYPIHHRQSGGTARRMIAIFPELVDTSQDVEDHLKPYAGLLLRNIRDGGVFKELSKDATIDNLALLNRLTNPENDRESIINPYLTSKNYLTLFKGVDNYNLFRFNYVADTGLTPRKGVPSNTVDYILKNPEIMMQIGIQYVALWLTTDNQFRLFEHQLYRAAFGKYYTRTGIKLPNWALEEDMLDNFAEIENIYLLELAAYGGYGTMGGLLENPMLPDELQIRLISDKSDSWGNLSSQAMGNYDDYIYIGGEKLSKNPGICSQAVEILLQSDFTEYKENIIKNSNISIGDKLVKEYLVDNPTALLYNYNLNIRTYNSIFKDWLGQLQISTAETEPRFQEFFNENSTARRITRSRRNGSASTLNGLQNYVTAKSWHRFWRGGTYKKKLNLNSVYNVAPVGDTGSPMALVDKPIFIEYPQVIWRASADWYDDLGEPQGADEGAGDYKARQRSSEDGLVLSNIRLQQIQEITEIDGLINVKGRTYTEDTGWSNLQQTYNNINDLYGFMEPDERQVPDSKWRDDIIIVIFDKKSPPDRKEIPKWRDEITEEQVKEGIRAVVSNPKNTSQRLIEICEMLSKIDKYITSKEWTLKLGKPLVLNYIDSTNQWAPDILDKFSQTLFGSGEQFNYLENMMPTNKLFEITMSDSSREVREYLDIPLRRISSIQEWMLSPKFETIVPIGYIHGCITNPEIMPRLKERAKIIRNKRLAEYLGFIRRDEAPEVNDAEESHQYEWRVYNSEMSDILVKYCETMHPQDARMQEVLMQNIVSGAEVISAEDLFDAGGGL